MGEVGDLPSIGGNLFLDEYTRPVDIDSQLVLKERELDRKFLFWGIVGGVGLATAVSTAIIGPASVPIGVKVGSFLLSLAGVAGMAEAAIRSSENKKSQVILSRARHSVARSKRGAGFV